MTIRTLVLFAVLSCRLLLGSDEGAPFATVSATGLQLLDREGNASSLIRLAPGVEDYDIHANGDVALTIKACVQGGGQLFIHRTKRALVEVRWPGSVFGSPPAYSSPAWSPDGRQLAFVVRQCVKVHKDTALMVGHMGIWRWETGGGSASVWSGDSEGDYQKPAWSADSKLIAANHAEGGFRVFEVTTHRSRFDSAQLAAGFIGSRAIGFIGNKCVAIRGSKDGGEFSAATEVVYLPDATIHPIAAVVPALGPPGLVSAINFPFFLSIESGRTLLGSFQSAHTIEAPPGPVQVVARPQRHVPVRCQ